MVSDPKSLTPPRDEQPMNSPFRGRSGGGGLTRLAAVPPVRTDGGTPVRGTPVRGTPVRGIGTPVRLGGSPPVVVTPLPRSHGDRHVVSAPLGAADDPPSSRAPQPAPTRPPPPAIPSLGHGESPLRPINAHWA